jgi:hypothetical protein
MGSTGEPTSIYLLFFNLIFSLIASIVSQTEAATRRILESENESLPFTNNQQVRNINCFDVGKNLFHTELCFLFHFFAGGTSLKTGSLLYGKVSCLICDRGKRLSIPKTK